MNDFDDDDGDGYDWPRAEDRLPSGWGLLAAFVVSCVLWGGLAYGAWWVWLR